MPCLADTGGRAQIEALLAHSPFGQSRLEAISAVANPLEFRAVLEEDDGLYFSLFEVAAHRSFWIKLHDNGSHISVEQYDSTTVRLTVNYEGKTFTLPLKGFELFARLNEPVARKNADKLDATDEGATDSPYHDRPFRVGHVIEEMQIRQAVRDETGAMPELSPPASLPIAR